MVFKGEEYEDDGGVVGPVAHGGASEFASPACASSDTAILPRGKRPGGWLTLTALRQCAACATIFAPEASVSYRVATIVSGVPNV